LAPAALLTPAAPSDARLLGRGVASSLKTTSDADFGPENSPVSGCQSHSHTKQQLLLLLLLLLRMQVSNRTPRNPDACADACGSGGRALPFFTVHGKMHPGCLWVSVDHRGNLTMVNGAHRKSDWMRPNSADTLEDKALKK